MGGDREIGLHADWGIDGKPALDVDGDPLDDGPALPIVRPEDQPHEGQLPADYDADGTGYDDDDDLLDVVISANPELGGDRVEAAIRRNLDTLEEVAADYPRIEAVFNSAPRNIKQFLVQHLLVVDPAPGRVGSLEKLALRAGLGAQLDATLSQLDPADLEMLKNRANGRGWRL